MKTTEKSQIELREIQEKLEALSNKINKIQKEKFETQIIDNADFIQLMNISNSTSRNWRNKGLIAYSQIENKIYYKVSDIQLLLNYHYSPFKFQP
jgi:DNA-binding transcriptional MerR regulator